MFYAEGENPIEKKLKQGRPETCSTDRILLAQEPGLSSNFFQVLSNTSIKILGLKFYACI